jgi:uncharacterized C2H2 Zn-finger protein
MLNYECPICKSSYKKGDDLHRHLEEAHDNIAGRDEELMEKTSGKEVLSE